MAPERPRHADADVLRIVPVDLVYLDQPGAALAFLIEIEGLPPALVECGPEACRPRLEEELRRHGVDPGAIGNLFLTHIHLDHAGAAGVFAARGTTVHMHPRGLRHLVDPARLNDSSRRVHGERFDRWYGPMAAIEPNRLAAAADGTTVDLGPVRFRAVETPGHAKHHHAWMLEHPGGRECFTGDVAAMVVPGSEFISVPTPATDFDPEAWDASLARLAAERPDRLWLTHGGRVDDAGDFLARARRRVAEEASFLIETALSCDDREALDRYRAWLHPHAEAAGVDRAVRSAFLGPAFLEMNLAGVRKLLKDRARAATLQE
jgi:glyoxylase-like metal-dependent hydrolase (beta-lactamase superfamily II)